MYSVKNISLQRGGQEFDTGARFSLFYGILKVCHSRSHDYYRYETTFHAILPTLISQCSYESGRRGGG